MANALTPLFVYGTLKRGGINHRFLDGQRYVGSARTKPGFVLYLLDGYPGMVAQSSDADGVTGEIWHVDAACLASLDEFEGVPEGLYRRIPVPLAEPHENLRIDAYVYAGETAGRRVIGDTWPV